MNNREINFRVWDKKQNRFLDNYEFILDYRGRVSNFTNENVDWWKDCILQQYTGLKDRDGKEIYEGDVLSYLQTYGPIHAEMVDFVVEWDVNRGKFNLDVLARCSVKILGNIFENPNLIK